MIDNEKVSFEKNFFGVPESENLASSRDLIQKIDNLTYQALKSQLRGPWVCHGSWTPAILVLKCELLLCHFVIHLFAHAQSYYRKTRESLYMSRSSQQPF